MAKARVSMVIEYEIDPESYPDCQTFEEMAEIDRQTIEENPEFLLELVSDEPAVQVEVIYD